MSKEKLLLIPILMVFLFTSQVSAQDCNNQTVEGDCVNTIITGVPFLRITPDARSGAMGGVGLGISPDANSIHLNASRLAFVENKGSFSATYTPWLRALQLNDVYIAYASGYYSPDDLQTFGASIRYFSLGNINFTNFNGEPIGQGSPNEFEIAFAYARKLSDNFSLAVTPKFIYSNLANNQVVGGGIEISPATAGAVDISSTYVKEISLGEKSADLRIAAAVTNLGSKVTYTESVNKDYIPANLGIGAGLDIDLDEFNKITFAFDINKLLVPTPTTINNDGDDILDYKQYGFAEAIFKSFGDAPRGDSEFRELMYSVGAEYIYDEQFAVRAGYFHEHNLKGGRQFFTVGLGLKYNIFGLNFSYLVPTTNQRNPLDNTLRFSLLFDFGAGGEVLE